MAGEENQQTGLALTTRPSFHEKHAEGRDVSACGVPRGRCQCVAWVFFAAEGFLCFPCPRFAQGVSHDFSARKLPWTATPADVAAETRFVIVLLLCSNSVTGGAANFPWLPTPRLSSFTSKERGSSVLGRPLRLQMNDYRALQEDRESLELAVIQ